MSGMQITQKAYEELQAKLKQLKVKRKEISIAIGEAREHGDIKENSAYHSAKQEQSLNESKIAQLESQLAEVEIVDESPATGDEVALGTTVTIQNIANGKEFEYTIVSELEADIFENKISTVSPLGTELLHGKVGDVVAVEAPAGIIKYKILSITRK